MGTMGGVVTFEGKPVDRSLLKMFGDRLGCRTSDTDTLATAGSIGMVFRAHGDKSLDQINPCALRTSPDGAILAFTGRVDNARQLAHSLGIATTLTLSRSDILLEGFERYGPPFAGKIIGDFAFAHWSPSHRRLTLGRDPVGVRTLYYHQRGRESFLFSTHLGSLVQVAKVACSVDEDYVAGFLASVPDLGRTVYRAVKAVRPGTVVIVSPGGTACEETVWALTPEPTDIVYKDDREYEEGFRHLFREAIQARLDTREPVFAELSGGVDSSSIVCMADHIVRTAPSSATNRLISVSRVLDRSTTGDESQYRRVVEAQCQTVSSLHVLESAVSNVRPMEGVPDFHVPNHLAICSGFEAVVCAHMRQLGATTLMSGIGGDEMFCSTSVPLPGLADLWRRGAYRRLHGALREWSVGLKVPYSRLAWQSFEMGVLNRWRRSGRMDEFPSWIHPRLHEQVRTLRAARERGLRDYRFPSHRVHASAFTGAVNLIASGERQDFDERNVTFPCLHRPLVEYMQTVPFSQKLRCGENRSLQRRALRDILPAEILNRRGKGNPREAFIREVREAAPQLLSLLQNSIAEACGYICAEQARESVKRMCSGAQMRESVPFAACALELWLRSHLAGPVSTEQRSVPEPIALV